MNGPSTESKQLNEHRKPVIRLGDNMRRLNKLSIIVCHTQSKKKKRLKYRKSLRLKWTIRKKHNEWTPKKTYESILNCDVDAVCARALSIEVIATLLITRPVCALCLQFQYFRHYFSYFSSINLEPRQWEISITIECLYSVCTHTLLYPLSGVDFGYIVIYFRLLLLLLKLLKSMCFFLLICSFTCET